MRLDVAPVSFRIQIHLERVFRDPALEAWSGQFGALKQGRLVIARPAVTARARLADVAGEHNGQVGRAIGFGCVKPVIDALALVNGGGFDRRQVFGQPLDQVLRSRSNLRNRVEVVILEVNLITGPCRGDFNFGAIGQLHLALEIQLRINARFGQPRADEVSMNRFRCLCFRIPGDEIAQLGVLLVRQPLHLHARPIRGEGGFVVRKNFRRAEPFEIVRANEQREISEALHECFVIPFVVHHQPGHTQPERRVRRRTHWNPVVAFRGRCAVFGSDYYDLAAAFHGFDEPMRISNLVFDQVFAVHDDQLGEAEIIEIALAVLKTVHPGLARRLIAVPGVIGPVAAGLGLFVIHTPHVDVQQRQRVAEAIHAVLAHYAEQAHAAAHFDRARPRPFHRLDHLRRVTLLFQQPRPGLAAVARGHRSQAFGDVEKRVAPGDALEGVGAARIKFVFRLQFRGELGEAVVRPALPAAPHDRMLEPIRPIDHAMERVALGAMPVAPIPRGLVAVEIGVIAYVIRLAHADDDAVAHVRRDATVVGVVGRADPGESVVISVLVAVELLPIAVWIVCQRIAQVGQVLRTQEPQRQHLRRCDSRANQTTASNEISSGKIVRSHS